MKGFSLDVKPQTKDSKVLEFHFILINDIIHRKDLSHKDLCPEYHYIKMYKSKTIR